MFVLSNVFVMVTWMERIGPSIFPKIVLNIHSSYMGQDNTVNIATCNGLDGPGIESHWAARFSTPVQTGPGAHLSSYAVGVGSFMGVKQLGHGVNQPPPSGAVVKESGCILGFCIFLNSYSLDITCIGYKLCKICSEWSVIKGTSREEQYFFLFASWLS
jgi:hypothetical protein